MEPTITFHHIRGRTGHFRMELRTENGKSHFFAVNTTEKSSEALASLPGVAVGGLAENPNKANDSWDGVLQDETGLHDHDVKKGVKMISRTIPISNAAYDEVYKRFAAPSKRTHSRSQTKTGTPVDYDLLPSEHSKNCVSLAAEVYGVVRKHGMLGELFTQRELSKSAAGIYALSKHRSPSKTAAMFRTALEELDRDGVPSSTKVSMQALKIGRRLGLDRQTYKTYDEAYAAGRKLWQAMRAGDEHGAAPLRKPLTAARPALGAKRGLAQRKPTVAINTLRADATAADPLDATPVAVVTASNKLGGQDVVTMRADTPFLGPDGKPTTIRKSMEADGYKLNPKLGGFLEPGAPKRELRWYDWRKNGHPLDGRKILNEPVKWYWPE